MSSVATAGAVVALATFVASAVALARRAAADDYDDAQAQLEAGRD